MQPGWERELFWSAVVLEAVLEEDTHISPFGRHTSENGELLQVARVNCSNCFGSVRVSAM